jgi:hypothetical protein
LFLSSNIDELAPRIKKHNFTDMKFIYMRGHRGHDRMVIGFITTYGINAYHH